MQIQSVNHLYSPKSCNFGRSSIPVFRGECDSNQSNKNIDDAVEIAKKLLALSADEIDLSVFEKLSDIPVRPLLQAKNLTTEAACLDSTFNMENGEISNLTIFIPPLKRRDKIGKTIYIMNFAHEYTHVNQFNNGQGVEQILYEDIKKKGFEPKEVMPAIYKAADACQRSLSGDIMRIAIEKVLGPEGRQSDESTGGMILTNALVTEDKIAASIGYINAETFRTKFKTSLQAFDKIAENICQTNSALRARYLNNPSGTVNRIKTILIAYCRNSAQAEKEAYLTENKIAALQGFNERGSELAYKYHAMLQNAL